MKISFLTLRYNGKKRRVVANPVSRSKSWADKNIVNMKMLCRDRTDNPEENSARKKYASNPDLMICSHVKMPDRSTPFIANSSSMNQGTATPPSPSNIMSSVGTERREEVYTPIKQSSLSIILPDDRETGRKRTRSAAPQKTAESKSKNFKSQKSSELCVEAECMVCTLARPALRHRVVLQPEIWREFY